MDKNYLFVIVKLLQIFIKARFTIMRMRWFHNYSKNADFNVYCLSYVEFAVGGKLCD